MTTKQTQDGQSADWQNLRQLVHERAFEFGHFILTSGKESAYYFDGKQVTLSPAGAYLFSKLIVEKIKGTGITAIGGLTIGADPIVGSVGNAAYEAGLADLKLFIVRKEPKKHGKCKFIEGPELVGTDRVAIIDDVITTGGSIMKAVEQVEALGGKVVKVIALVDRQEGGTEMLQAKGIDVDPVFVIGDFIQANETAHVY
ncbi:MAG: orotate phosphoribosyltransferase [Peptococcaceae bacterium]|nr:orotate phosphoribosyltransferase [Peptococcaceae bacterium]